MSHEAEKIPGANTLASQLANLLGVRQGSFEVHMYKGECTGIDRLDKSLRFGRDAPRKRLASADRP